MKEVFIRLDPKYLNQPSSVAGFEHINSATPLANELQRELQKYYPDCKIRIDDSRPLQHIGFSWSS